MRSGRLAGGKHLLSDSWRTGSELGDFELDVLIIPFLQMKEWRL